MLTPLPQTVVFELYAPLQVLAVWRQLRRCEQVVFSRRVPFEVPPAWRKRAALAIVRSLNSRAAIRELTVADLLDYLPLNARAVDDVAALATELQGAPTYVAM